MNSYEFEIAAKNAVIELCKKNFNETYDILGYHGISDYDWQLILVNKNNPVPYDYEVELTTLSNGVQVDSRIYPDLQKMFDDMRDNYVSENEKTFSALYGTLAKGCVIE